MDPPTGLLTNSEELRWDAQEVADPNAGERAHLFGQPNGAGFYGFRLRLGPGYVGGRPHWHPDFEFGTVIQGAFLVACGERLSRSDARRLTSGAFIVIPPRVWHAIWAEEEVILQIVGPGPRATNFEGNPQDARQ